MSNENQAASKYGPLAERSGLAVASAIAGIAGIVLGQVVPASAFLVVSMLLVLAGGVMGVIAIIKINWSNGYLTGKGWAIAGIVIAVLYFGVICLLTILGRSVERAFSTIDSGLGAGQ